MHSARVRELTDELADGRRSGEYLVFVVCSIRGTTDSLKGALVCSAAVCNMMLMMMKLACKDC